MNSRAKQLALRQKNALSDGLLRLTLFCMAILIFITCTGCSNLEYRRFAYETLRQVDCKVNELDDFCNRTFANDFHEYERMREDYLTNDAIKESWLSRDSYENQ